jgi:hypothetical protein
VLVKTPFCGHVVVSFRKRFLIINARGRFA